MKKSKLIQLDIPIERVEFKYCFGGVPMAIDFLTFSDAEILDTLEEMIEVAKEFEEPADEIIFNMEEIQFCTNFIEDTIELVHMCEEGEPYFIGFFTTPNLETGLMELHGIAQIEPEGAVYIFTNSKRVRNFLMTDLCQSFIFVGDDSKIEEYLDDAQKTLEALAGIYKLPKKIEPTDTAIQISTQMNKSLIVKPKKIDFELK